MKRHGWLMACALSAAALAGAWAQVLPEAVQSLPYAAVGGEPSSESELALSLSPGGKLLAVSDGGRVWLYRRDAGERIAVTPAPVPRRPYNAAGVTGVEGMQWQSDAALLAWVRLQNGSAQAYAADAGGARGPVLQAQPAPGPDLAAFVARHHITTDPDFILNAYANRQTAVWTENRGHGSLVLMEQAPGGKPRPLAQGGWELDTVVFDDQASRVIYATDLGLAVHGVPEGRAELISGTRAGDLAYDFDSASRWLVLVRQTGGCDAASAASKERHVCLVRLPPAAAAKDAAQPVPAAPPSGPQAQPSFDCSKARSTTEQLLCERAPLAALDVELSGLYRQALERGPNASALKKQQIDWMRERDARCTAGKTLAQARADLLVDACLRESYHQRIRLLWWLLRGRGDAPEPDAATGLSTGMTGGGSGGSGLADLVHDFSQANAARQQCCAGDLGNALQGLSGVLEAR